MSTDHYEEVTVRYTTDPTLVRTLVDERGGFPAHLSQSEGTGDQGLLRIGFPDVDEEFKEISLETFEAEFEEKDLAAIYPEDETETIDGVHPMRLVSREEAEEVGESRPR